MAEDLWVMEDFEAVWKRGADTRKKEMRVDDAAERFVASEIYGKWMAKREEEKEKEKEKESHGPRLTEDVDIDAFFRVHDEARGEGGKENGLDVPLWTADEWAGWAAFETQNRKEWEEEKRNNA